MEPEGWWPFLVPPLWSLEPEERIRQAYGENFDRLVEIKQRWDAENLFRMN